jgi:hypothetical protein
MQLDGRMDQTGVDQPLEDERADSDSGKHARGDRGAPMPDYAAVPAGPARNTEGPPEGRLPPVSLKQDESGARVAIDGDTSSTKPFAGADRGAIFSPAGRADRFDYAGPLHREASLRQRLLVSGR